MAGTIVCPKCGLQGNLPDGFQAPQVRCPRCNSVIAVRGAAPAGAPELPPPPVNGHPDPIHRTLDQFFAGAFSPGPRSAGPAPAPAAPPAVAAPEIPPRPAPDPHGDPQVEREWLREEHERLQAYMRRNFALLQQQRQEFDGWRSQVEAALVSREQELNRQKKILSSQQAASPDRVAAVPATLPEAANPMQEDIAARRVEMEELRRATANLKADYVALGRAVEGRKRALETAEVRETCEVDQGTPSLAQRERDIQELEKQIHDELQRQEQDLTRQRLELQEWRDQVAQESREKEVLRRKVGTLGRELEQLRRSAGKGPGS